MKFNLKKHIDYQESLNDYIIDANNNETLFEIEEGFSVTGVLDLIVKRFSDTVFQIKYSNLQTENPLHNNIQYSLKINDELIISKNNSKIIMKIIKIIDIQNLYIKIVGFYGNENDLLTNNNLVNQNFFVLF